MEKTGRTERILNAIERTGNRLPDPAILFLFLCIGVLGLSLVASLFSLSAIHPVTGEKIESINLLNTAGLHKILTQTVSNFVTFAPVGSVLVAILGIGIAEKSGLIATLLRSSLQKAPHNQLTFFVILTAVLANLAMDTGYVVLIPLAAMVYASAGRHPLIGIAASFAGVSGGYSANILIGPVDTILAGISTEAAALADPNYHVSAAGNYYFMIASTALVTLVGTWVTEKFVAPRFDHNLSVDKTPSQTHEVLSTQEKRALKAVGLFSLVFITVIFAGLIPQGGFLRNPETHSILTSPFIKGIVTIIAFYTGVCGYIFGKLTGKYKTSHNLSEAMNSSMVTMASYLVLIFFAAQFVNYFAWSQIGTIIAISGANFLKALAIESSILLVFFVFIAALINIFIGSASAKWALIAPVFVPMLLLAGISPEATQVAFRIGDSSTNIITPLMPYFGVVVAFAQKYDTSIGMGTIISMMLPYSMAFLVAWTGLMLAWYAIGIPLGPGASF